MCTWFEKRKQANQTEVMLCSMHLSGWTSYKPAARALAERYSRREDFQKMAVEEGVAVLNELFQVHSGGNEVKQGEILNLCYAYTDREEM